jgi:cytochrome c oxidase subunit IV
MDTAVEHDTAHAEGHGGHKEHSDLVYIQVAIALAVMTGIEVALSYAHIGKLFLPLLLVIMAIKFITVVLFFMHLKFDNKLFSFLFWSGLVLALGVYIAALATMKFFVK